MPNFGSFGSPALSPEDMQAIKEAIARRQQGGNMPMIDQVSGGLPSALPPPPNVTGSPPPMMGSSPVDSGMSSIGMSTPQPEITQLGDGMEAQEPGMSGNFSAEKEIILGAMDNYLKHIAKMEKDQLTPATPPTPPFMM